MPNTITLTVPAADVKVNDRFDGLSVTGKRTLNVNVELTLSTGVKRRIRSDANVVITRDEPTVEEKRQKLVDGLDYRVAEVVKNVEDVMTKGDAAIRAELEKSSDLLYTFQWHAEDYMVQLHTIRLLSTLHNALNSQVEIDNGVTQAETIVTFVERIKREMLDWSPGRSTSRMHNLSDDARFTAMKNLVNGSFSSYGISGVLYYVEALAEFDAEHAS